MESEQKVKCSGCKQAVGQAQFKTHVKTCARYEGIAMKSVRNLNKDVSPSILKFYHAELEVCAEIVKDLIKKSELQALLQYNKVLEEKMKAMQNMKGTIDNLIAMHNLDGVFDDFSSFNYNTSQRKNPTVEPIKYPNLQPARQIVNCKICNKKLDAITDSKVIFINQECGHKFCVPCVTKYIDKEFPKHFGNLPCQVKDCKKAFKQLQIKQLVGDKKFKQYEQAYNHQLRMKMNLKKCCACHCEFEFVECPLSEAPTLTPQGDPISSENRIYYCKNRFICPNSRCKTVQCKQCKATPYHVGRNCQQFKAQKDMLSQVILKIRNCRYCNRDLTPQSISYTNQKALADICNSAKCQNVAKNACNKLLPCGHSCLGLKNDITCLPCMNEACSKDIPEMAAQRSKDYCRLCSTQTLGSSPCVKSNCGHIYHEKCLKNRLQGKWKTPRMSFNFCKCPVCKRFMSLAKESQTEVAILLRNTLHLFVKVQSMAIQRLQLEQCQNDPKLKDPKSPFYQKQYEYSMAVYSYYQCFKCKKPYYGGKRNCNEMEQPQLFSNFKIEDLICPECCPLQSENCAKHGKTYVQFKCRFCCQPASWFASGTHYCQPCYKVRQYVSKLSADGVTKCPGADKCPIGGNHGGNGAEKSFGCTICKVSEPKIVGYQHYWR